MAKLHILYLISILTMVCIAAAEANMELDKTVYEIFQSMDFEPKFSVKNTDQSFINCASDLKDIRNGWFNGDLWAIQSKFILICLDQLIQMNFENKFGVLGFSSCRFMG